MARRTPPPQQRLTVRQAIMIVSIIALTYFAFKYGQNVLHYRRLQARLAKIETNIAEVDAKQESINQAFDESLSPAVVDDFAKREMNWVRPGDQIIVTVGRQKTTGLKQPASSGKASGSQQPTEQQIENWQLWLKMLSGQ